MRWEIGGSQEIVKCWLYTMRNSIFELRNCGLVCVCLWMLSWKISMHRYFFSIEFIRNALVPGIVFTSISRNSIRAFVGCSYQRVSSSWNFISFWKSKYAFQFYGLWFNYILSDSVCVSSFYIIYLRENFSCLQMHTLMWCVHHQIQWIYKKLSFFNILLK